MTEGMEEIVCYRFAKLDHLEALRIKYDTVALRLNNVSLI